MGDLNIGLLPSGVCLIITRNACLWYGLRHGVAVLDEHYMYSITHAHSAELQISQFWGWIKNACRIPYLNYVKHRYQQSVLELLPRA